VIEAFQQLWHQIIEAITPFVIPDWGELVGLLPIFLLLGAAGPIMSLLLLGWIVYVVRAPRAKVSLEVGPVRAQLVDGRPDYPAGEPYCPVDRLIFPFGTSRCDVGGHDLFVRCPKCATGRPAHLSICGNCGLVLKIENRARALRPAGPPPGGAAAA